MKFLITGGCGFLGSNIASKLLQNGQKVIVFDNLNRVGSTNNLEWLKTQGLVEFIHGDIRNTNDVNQLLNAHKPDIVYHLAGQVAMTTSILDPRKDFEINTLGTFNLLEAIRNFSTSTGVIYSSTNKVYGSLDNYTYNEDDTRFNCVEKPLGFDENEALSFHSPYGTSKGAADQYVLDYSRIFNIQTTVFRHSSMYGGRQFATEDQGWVGWFVGKAIEAERKSNDQVFSISGNGKQVRDLLYADDCVELYLKAASHLAELNGKSFNIGGGIDNSCSLLELFNYLEKKLSIKLHYTKDAERVSDQKVFIADTTHIQSILDWAPKIDKYHGIDRMIDWVRKK